jgi:pimeloyl-ACP methyl ester carboxylesterase
MTPLAIDLAARGIAAWNVEYRRVGQEGGAWPGTLEDVAAAADLLAGIDDVDTTRIATCGHSAGGHLALWLAGRHRIQPGMPGAGPLVRPVAAVAQAGVCDLEQAWRDGLGRGAVEGLLGSFADVPERYAAASPVALGPLGVPQLLVHGDADAVVPVAQSREYAARDPDAELVELRGVGHFEVIEPASTAWVAVLDRLDAYLGGSNG